MPAQPCVVHERTSLTSLTLLLQQCPACLACLPGMVCEMGGWWPYNCCFVWCRFQDLFKTTHRIPVLFPSSLFSICFVSSSSLDTAPTWKKSHFILLDKSDFHMIENLSIASYAFARCMLTSLSVDKMLLLRYMNWSTNFRDSPLTEMSPFCLKHVYSVLFVFT